MTLRDATRSERSLAYLDGPERTVPVLLQRQAERHGGKKLVSVAGVALSYDRAPEVAGRMAATLAGEGIQAGDRVAVMCSNRMELLELVLGCAWLGAIAVPLNTASRGQQLGHMLRNSGARLLVVEATLADRLETCGDLPELERVWLLDGSEHTCGRPRFERAPQPSGAAPPSPARPQDTAIIMYTSGTTGPAKGVCISQGQLYSWGISVAELLELSESDVILNPMPLFHINALSTPLQALVTGASCVIEPKFSASRFWARAASVDASVVYLLGTMASMLLARPEGPEDREHRVTLALAPGASPEVTAAFSDRFGVRVAQAYASTETNCAIGSRLDEQRPGMLGYEREGFEARVVDEDDVPVPDGTPGELVLRHREPFAFASGYFRMPEKTVEAWRNLWFHTGDRVVREPDGWFRFVDRMTDSIRRRGENISSFDVEQALADHEAVAAVAAFGVPSELGEHEVMVAVVLKGGVEVEPVELIRHCEPRLAYFALPRYVDLVEELPLTENGKVRKALLRERGVSTTTWDREAAGYVVSKQ